MTFERGDLSPAQAEFQRGFAGFCRQRIAPRAREADRGGHISAATWQDLAAVGYFGLFHPVARGGSGADAVTLAIAMESLSRACASTFWSASISTCLCGSCLRSRDACVRSNASSSTRYRCFLACRTSFAAY